MKLSYKQRIFLYFFIIFAVFSLTLVIIEQRQEKKQKTEALELRLEKYTDLIEKYINLYHLNDSTFNQLFDLDIYLLDDVRITIVDARGNVLYDKDINDKSLAENHLQRPEIQEALKQTYASDIRRSVSTNKEYIYYAKYVDPYYIRVALPYNLETKSLLKTSQYFVYVVFLLFIVVLIMFNYVAGRFSKSILQLKDFTSKVKNENELPENIQFPDDELGEIGRQLVDIFNQKIESKQEIEIEREKLIQHIQYSKEGLCIFTSDRKKIFANTYFVQYLNIILDTNVSDVESIFKFKVFKPLIDFLSDRNRKSDFYSYKLDESGKTFTVQVVVFDDDSFEVTIEDITEIEKNRLLKQQMTSNIAHELRTPVTSLRAYLETLSDANLSDEKRSQFVERAYLQSIRLSELIEDVSLISKIEEAPSLFKMEKMNLLELISEVKSDLDDNLEKANIKVNISVDDDVFVTANQSLLYSVFRNLIDNTVKYAGENVQIHINHYLEDEHYHYFSFYDTGKGIEEEHLNRIFERFYRIDSGRTREAGGSGLGLSIVKNAVLLHKGKIQAKKHHMGGLQFLFTLKK